MVQIVPERESLGASKNTSGNKSRRQYFLCKRSVCRHAFSPLALACDSLICDNAPRMICSDYMPLKAFSDRSTSALQALNAVNHEFITGIHSVSSTRTTPQQLQSTSNLTSYPPDLRTSTKISHSLSISSNMSSPSRSRNASHAGSWYSADGAKLSRDLDKWLDQIPRHARGIGAVSAESEVELPSSGARVVIAP